jgi:3-oxoacyl-[acyl-carrier-protein] synthase-1
VSALVLGVGARAATGLDALQVTMSERADRLRVRGSHMLDRAGEPIGVCRLPSIGDATQGIDRLLALAAPALVQAARALGPLARAAAVPVLVALPSSSRPGFDPRLPQHFLRALEALAGVPFDHARSKQVHACRAGGAEAFEHALGLLSRGADVALVGGVDSYFDPDVLDWLDGELRLHSSTTENGFIPGEGAAFVALARRGAMAGQPALCEVLAAATELEPHPWPSPEPCLGLGMQAALERAARPLGVGARRVDHAMSDVTNERHRVDEWQLAMQRAHEVFTVDAVHEQPLLSTGDVGAASVPMLAAIAATRWQTGCATGSMALLAGHSDGPLRGAVLLGDAR